MLQFHPTGLSHFVIIYSSLNLNIGEHHMKSQLGYICITFVIIKSSLITYIREQYMQSQTGYTKQLKRINNKIMKQEQNITLRKYKSSSNKTMTVMMM